MCDGIAKCIRPRDNLLNWFGNFIVFLHKRELSQEGHILDDVMTEVHIFRVSPELHGCLVWIEEESRDELAKQLIRQNIIVYYFGTDDSVFGQI